MKRFIVNLAVWHDDIRTNHGGVFTQPRPKPARRVSPKLPDAQQRLLAFRIYEAAVRDLQQPAITGPW
jgi:hypothetical protein